MSSYKKKMPIKRALEVLEIEVDQLYPYIHDDLIDAIETLLYAYNKVKEELEQVENDGYRG